MENRRESGLKNSKWPQKLAGYEAQKEMRFEQIFERCVGLWKGTKVGELQHKFGKEGHLTGPVYKDERVLCMQRG